MLINEFSKPVTVKSINENLAKKYGKTINVDKFTTEQLEDARNRLRTTLSQVETNESFDAVHTSETYQKNKMFLELLNTAISERQEIEEAQSPAQKAAFAKMLAKKSGKKPAEGKEKETDEGNAYSGAVAKAKMNGKKKGDKVKGPDGDEITLEEKTPKKMDVTDADKKANSPAYQQMKKGNPRYNDKTTRKLPERGQRAKKSKKYTSESYNATLQANLAALITK